MVSAKDLLVRRTARLDLVLPARVSIAEQHAQIVRLSSTSGQHSGWVDCDLIDLSSGGAGLVTPVFFPRKCVLNIEVFRSGAESAVPILSCHGMVQRIVMTDRRPAYLIGISLVRDCEAAENTIDTFIVSLSEKPKPSSPDDRIERSQAS